FSPVSALLWSLPGSLDVCRPWMLVPEGTVGNVLAALATAAPASPRTTGLSTAIVRRQSKAVGSIAVSNLYWCLWEPVQWKCGSRAETVKRTPVIGITG